MFGEWETRIWLDAEEQEKEEEGGDDADAIFT